MRSKSVVDQNIEKLREENRSLKRELNRYKLFFEHFIDLVDTDVLEDFLKNKKEKSEKEKEKSKPTPKPYYDLPPGGGY